MVWNNLNSTGIIFLQRHVRILLENSSLELRELVCVSISKLKLKRLDLGQNKGWRYSRKGKILNSDPCLAQEVDVTVSAEIYLQGSHHRIRDSRGPEIIHQHSQSLQIFPLTSV